MKTWHLQSPLNLVDLSDIHIGDAVLLSGTIYTARDAAHKKLTERVLQKQNPPFPLKGAVLFFMGPTPAPPMGILPYCLIMD
jgi:fumarate hydratase subunit beta